MNNLKAHRCFTRAMKNARFLQKVAPHIIQKDILPTDLLSKLHTLDSRSEEVKSHPELTQFLDENRFPAIGRLPAGSLFSGTIHFVHMTFRTPGGNISINDNDMTTIMEYASRAIIPISRYASEYGRNRITVSPFWIEYSVTLQGTTYNDQALQGWVNDIVNQNNLPLNGSCIFVVSPQGLTASQVGDNGGYHQLANVPYIILGVFKQNLTLQDLQDAYAMGVSHEIAEMVVDPNVDHVNPEVCDPCDVNCHVLYRNYFDSNNQYISTTRNLPPGFDYMYYISGIVRPSSATMCPAPDSACSYGPPP